MAALSTCCLEVCQEKRQKPILLSFETALFLLTMPCQGDYVPSIQMSKDSSQSSLPLTMGTELLFHSSENCSIIKAQGLFVASAELHVFATTESRVCERVRESRVYQKNNGGFQPCKVKVHYWRKIER